MDSPNTMLDPAEAARHLGGSAPISVRTLANWRADGAGPAFVKVGGAIRYRRSDLDEWLAEQTRNPRRAK